MADGATSMSHDASTMGGNMGSAHGSGNLNTSYLQTPPRNYLRQQQPTLLTPTMHPQRSPQVNQPHITMTSSPWSTSPRQSDASLSPKGLYDRRDQVGLGELTTPRWMMSHGHPDADFPQRLLPLDSPAYTGSVVANTSGGTGDLSTPGVAATRDRNSAREKSARAISYSLSNTNHASSSKLMPSFSSMQFDEAPVDFPSPPIEPYEVSSYETPARRADRRWKPPTASTASVANGVDGAGTSATTGNSASAVPAGAAGPPPAPPPASMPVQMENSLHSPPVHGSLTDITDNMYHMNMSPLSTPQTQSSSLDVFLDNPAQSPFQSQSHTQVQPPYLKVHPQTYSSQASSVASSVPSPSIPSQERAGFSRVEEQAGPDHSRWSVAPAQAPPSPSVLPSGMTFSEAAVPTSETMSSPRVPKSPRWRQRAVSRVDDTDESSSLAGRLSRRSLVALSSLFKSSPRRTTKDVSDTNAGSAGGSTGNGTTAIPSAVAYSSAKVATPEPSTPPSRSRLSFSRRRRQSLQHVRNSLARQARADQPGVPDVPHVRDTPNTRASTGANFSTPTKYAPNLPPKSSRREGADVVVPLRTEPSPYYTAKAQGSRIPRASSMMRILRRKSGDQDDLRESRLPVSSSMQSISSASESPFVSLRSNNNQNNAGQRSEQRPLRTSSRKAVEASPVKARTLRKSQASAEAAEALRRQQTAQTNADVGMSTASLSIPATSTNANATSVQETARSHASRTPSMASSTLESGIPVPTDVRRRPPSAQSRRSIRVSVDDSQAGDDEMERHIQRVFRRKLAGGARYEDLEKQLAFPQPTAATKRLSPRQAEVIYGNHMCPYEQQEIHQYDSIYYVGSYARHKHYAVPEKTDRNYGYDDERGDYIVNLRDHLAYRYEILKSLGRGSFGQVLQCRDHKTGQYVAIKLIRNKRRFHHQAVVEVRIMEHLTRADPDGQHHVVHMTDSFTFRHHLCVTMELLSINLYELIKANSFEGFSATLIRRFTLQTLQCLALMRQARIVHCDLKPENILLVHPRRSEIRVIDFGSSCYEDEKVYTYIQSRFYRSPEVILGMEYNMAIDMWSLGCILVELFTGYPIFPGENEHDQLACIMEVLGLPDRHLLEKSTRTKLFFDSTGAPRPVVTSRGQKRRPQSKPLASVLRTNDEWFLDFVARCLTWDPERRIKADAALHHPWFVHRADSVIPRLPQTRRLTRPDTARSLESGSLLPRATPASHRS